MNGARPILVLIVNSTPSWYTRNARGRGGRLGFVSLGAFGGYPDEIRDVQGRAGAYVIRDRGKVAYVGRATDDLYKAATRHFQQWERSARARRSRPATDHDPGVTYARATSAVAVVPTPPGRAAARQRELIAELAPRDNVHNRPRPDDEGRR